MPIPTTPDGVRYLAMAEGKRVCRPFNLRWLMPMLLGKDRRLWFAAAVSSTVILGVLVGLLAPTWQTGLAAGAMFVALPSVRFQLRRPILVDLPAMACGLGAAYATIEGYWWAGVLLALLAGCCKETAPIFAACWAWNPILLIGLVAPVMAYLLSDEGPDPIPSLAWVQEHPLRASWQAHKGLYLTGMMLAPWGGAIVGLANLDARTIVALVLAYGSLLVATDTVRLYQWAAPTLLICAVTAVPLAWLPVLVAWTIWNPLGSDGI